MPLEFDLGGYDSPGEPMYEWRLPKETQGSEAIGFGDEAVEQSNYVGGDIVAIPDAAEPGAVIGMDEQLSNEPASDGSEGADTGVPAVPEPVPSEVLADAHPSLPPVHGNTPEAPATATDVPIVPPPTEFNGGAGHEEEPQDFGVKRFDDPRYDLDPPSEGGIHAAAEDAMREYAPYANYEVDDDGDEVLRLHLEVDDDPAGDIAFTVNASVEPPDDTQESGDGGHVMGVTAYFAEHGTDTVDTHMYFTDGAGRDRRYDPDLATHDELAQQPGDASPLEEVGDVADGMLLDIHMGGDRAVGTTEANYIEDKLAEAHPHGVTTTQLNGALDVRKATGEKPSAHEGEVVYDVAKDYMERALNAPDSQYTPLEEPNRTGGTWRTSDADGRIVEITAARQYWANADWSPEVTVRFSEPGTMPPNWPGRTYANPTQVTELKFKGDIFRRQVSCMRSERLRGGMDGPIISGHAMFEQVEVGVQEITLLRNFLRWPRHAPANQES
jgi:hypothetical protein